MRGTFLILPRAAFLLSFWIVYQRKGIFMNQSKQLVRLIEIAIMTAAAVILDIVSGMFLSMPQGGSISIMMIPIFLISFRWGVKAGLTLRSADWSGSNSNRKLIPTTSYTAIVRLYYRVRSYRNKRMFRFFCP